MKALWGEIKESRESRAPARARAKPGPPAAGRAFSPAFRPACPPSPAPKSSPARPRRSASTGRTPAQVVGKIQEEVREVREARQPATRDGIEDEIGDLLFAVVNLARHAGVDPETRASPHQCEVRAPLRRRSSKRLRPGQDARTTRPSTRWKSSGMKAKTAERALSQPVVRVSAASGKRWRKRGSFPARCGPRRGCGPPPSVSALQDLGLFVEPVQALPVGGLDERRDRSAGRRQDAARSVRGGSESPPRSRPRPGPAGAPPGAPRGPGEALALARRGEQVGLVPDLDDARSVSSGSMPSSRSTLRDVLGLGLASRHATRRGHAAGHRPRSRPRAWRGRPRRASSAGRR